MSAPRCVVDTNVILVADGKWDDPERKDVPCEAACAAKLDAIMRGGHVFVDSERAILGEYSTYYTPGGPPGPGSVFLKWLLTNEWNRSRVTQVAVTPKPGSSDDFEEVPEAEGVFFDPSDRKFIAVAAAHPERPPILEAVDSKWWGWREALAAAGISVQFVCPEVIERLFKDKMES